MSREHVHTRVDYNRVFALGVSLNTLFVAIEAGFGIFSGSLVLLADAGHNLSDVLSLLLAWGANTLAQRASTEKRTYGFQKATVIASLASAILLLVVLGGIGWEAVRSFFDPRPVAGRTVMVVAAIGVAINALTALLFVKGQKHDLNIRGAFLHMAADAGVSLGVVVAGFLIMIKGWLWVDPVASLLIMGFVFFGTWGLLRESLDYAMDAVPKSVDIRSISHYLTELDRVNRIHDLHIWPLSTTEIALTVHLVVSGGILDNAFLREIQQHLHDHFNIQHATIQVETTSEEDDCLLDRQKCRE